MSLIRWRDDHFQGWADASDLGFPPGVWPRETVVDGIRLKKLCVRRFGEEGVIAEYETDDRKLIQVFND